MGLQIFNFRFSIFNYLFFNLKPSTLHIKKNMIDWLNLLFNSIWILALALALSVVSFAYWEAHIGGKKLRALLGQYRYAFPLILAGVVFCLGMAATSAKWWEWIFWEISVILFGIRGWKVNKLKNEN